MHAGQKWTNVGTTESILTSLATERLLYQGKRLPPVVLVTLDANVSHVLEQDTPITIHHPSLPYIAPIISHLLG